MNHEKILIPLGAFVLSVAAAVGTAGSFATAFDLPLADPNRWIFCCALCGAAASLVFSLPRGDWAAACILALSLGWLWREGTLIQQTVSLGYRILRIYDRAYGLGLLAESAGGESPADWPLAALACLTAIAVCRCLCGRRRIFGGVLACLVPMLACIVVTDTVPGEGYLFVWMASMILMILPATVRRENALQGLGLTAAAAVPVVLGLMLLFHFLPQGGYVNYAEGIRTRIAQSVRAVPEKLEAGALQLAAELRAEPPDRVDLRLVGPQSPFSYGVMEVTSEDGGILYLRGQDYDVYDGLVWSASENRQESFDLETGKEELLTIFVRSDLPLLYLPYYAEADLVGGVAENPENARTYTLKRTKLPEDWRRTVYSSGDTSLPEGVFDEYLGLPESADLPAREILESLHLSGSHTAKADAIAAFVTNCAGYDRNTPPMPREAEDFAIWFLREADSGYCIHFATAATVLLRAAGIPARYVTGYLTEVQPGLPGTVTEEDAHAWAEYYEPILDCWIPLEATPADQPEPETEPVTHPSTEPSQPEMYQSEPSPESRIPATDASDAAVISPPESGFQQDFRLLAVPVLLFLTVMAVMTQRTLRLELRRARQRRGDVNAQALARWREAARLSRLLKDTPPEALVFLAEKAKFSNHTLKPEELQQFDGYIRTCHRQLKQRSVLHQLLYRYLYAIY